MKEMLDANAGNYMFFIFYIIPCLGCYSVVVYGFHRMYKDGYAYGIRWCQGVECDPFILVVFAGFGVFPGINSAMLMIFLAWVFWRRSNG